MPTSYDVLINEQPYNFGVKGGLRLGKSQIEPAPALQVGTIEVPSFHHGPGQLVGRDPAKYFRASRVDTSRPGLLLPAGDVNVRHSTSDAAFDGGIHGAGWFQVNGRAFLITPNKVYELTHGTNSFAVVYTNAAGHFFTGSSARWRGKVILPREKAPAVALGGDSSTRYAESSPAVYDIAANTFSAALGAGYYCSHIVSAKGSIWWIQNRGRFAAPHLYWSDDTETDFGSFGAGRLYGPFDDEQGGYCSRLYMAGPHIMIFKRDGSITGVDEAKIWTSYSPERGPIDDDLFGLGLVQYLSVIVLNSESGALVFNPASLSMDSLEPSRVQSFVAKADANFIGKVTAFTVRDSELYAFGRTPNGVAVYTGMRYENEGFFYSSDYGVYAIPDTVAAPGTQAFTLRSASGGSMVRATAGANQRTLRKIVAAVTFDETPMAATIFRHTGPEHFHMFVAHRIEANDKLKIYQINLATPGWTVGPSSVTVGQLITSRLFGEGRGVTQLPLQIRGFANVPNIGVGEDGLPILGLTVSLGIEEGSPSVMGRVTTTGAFTLPISSDLLGQAGRYFVIQLDTPQDAGFRLETPLYLDVLYALTGGPAHDAVTITVTVGDQPDAFGNISPVTSPHWRYEALLNIQNKTVDIAFRWGAIWKVFVEKVDILLQEPDLTTPGMPGQYAVALQCRRLN